MEIEEYIKHQFDEDIALDNQTMKEYVDSFSYEPTNKKKR